MKTKLFSLLILTGLCGLWSCAKTKPAAVGAQPTANTNIKQPSAPDPEPEQPVKRTAHAAKTAPVNAPKVKSSSNDVAHQQETPAPKETSVAPKVEARETKPIEMKVANSFDQNPYLTSVLTPLVSPPNNLKGAAMGFKNQRQFIATLHLSRNLVIPFDQIKIRVTGDHRMSLSDSLRDIRPSITKSMAKAEVNKAEQQAKDDESRAKDEAKRAASKDKLATNRK